MFVASEDEEYRVRGVAKMIRRFLTQVSALEKKNPFRTAYR